MDLQGLISRPPPACLDVDAQVVARDAHGAAEPVRGDLARCDPPPDRLRRLSQARGGLIDGEELCLGRVLDIALAHRAVSGFQGGKGPSRTYAAAGADLAVTRHPAVERQNRRSAAWWRASRAIIRVDPVLRALRHSSRPPSRPAPRK